ncbi:MAG: ABC transporter permease [Nitrospirota bacterium]|nr:ABC transporter permease [Nitrospirota bacterium]
MEWRRLWTRLKKEPLALTSAVVIVLIVVAAVGAPLVAPFDPLGINLDALRLPPDGAHLLGTDSKGRDVLSRVIYGGRASLGIALVAAGVSVVIGLAFGTIAGYFGGKIDMAVVALVDLLLSFPSLLLAVGITVVLPAGAFSVVLALALVGWGGFARLVRGVVLSIREQAYVEAARSIGCSSARILIRHILPNCGALIVVVTSIRIGGFIMSEAALSFLGLGIQPPIPTWGSMISLNRAYILSAPWMVLFPGLALFVTVMAFNIFGDFLRDYLDPRMKG